MSSKRFVLTETLSQTVHEPPEGYLELRSDRVAFVASYGATNIVSRSLAALVNELESCGYFVVLIRASDSSLPLVWPSGYENDRIVIYRPNIGYDFGSWATGMAFYSTLLSSQFVLLVNDSLVGPFGSLAHILQDFESRDCDVWAVTNTFQIFPHLQSYFLGFKNGILTDRVLKKFWSEIEILSHKEEIIEYYEIGLSRLLRAEGYLFAACFENAFIAREGDNPSVSGWRNLLDLGFPFVKRQLLTVPDIVFDANDIVETIRSYYGEDVWQWL